MLNLTMPKEWSTQEKRLKQYVDAVALQRKYNRKAK